MSEMLPILIRLRTLSTSIFYDPLTESSASGLLALQCVERASQWHGRKAHLVASRSQSGRFPEFTSSSGVLWTEATDDLAACLEAMRHIAASSAVLCYPEFLWLPDITLPTSVPEDTVWVWSSGYSSVIVLDADVCESIVGVANALRVNVGGLHAVAAFIQQLPPAALPGKQVQCFKAPGTGSNRSALVLDDRASAQQFLAVQRTGRSQPDGLEGCLQTHSEHSTDVRSVLFVCGTSGHSGAEEMMLRMASGLQARNVQTILSIPLEGWVAQRFRAHGGLVECDSQIKNL